MKKQKLMIESIKYITGNKKSLKIQGPTKFVQAYKNALLASKNLYEGLHLENQTLDKIEVLVEKKKEAARAFELATGSNWPF